MPRKRQPTDAVIEYLTTAKLDEATLLLRVVTGLVTARGRKKEPSLVTMGAAEKLLREGPHTEVTALKITGGRRVRRVRRVRRGRRKAVALDVVAPQSPAAPDAE